MIKRLTIPLCALLLSGICSEALYANHKAPKLLNSMYTIAVRDTSGADLIDDEIKVDTIAEMIRSLQKFKSSSDTLNMRAISVVPHLSLQQMIKGNLAGVHVQEPSGEPGTLQSMIVQGPSGVLFSNKDVYNLQPAVYLNGAPLVQDNPFAFDVQKYDYNRIGPATNLLSQIDFNNIESIVVVKDPFELAKLGPNAANGAIYITTKNAKSGVRDISLNSYFGFVTRPKVNTVNGVYENEFRRPFYDRYAWQEENDNYASYLRDSTNTAYFGPSNWSDLYYRNTPTYSADLGITGGNERASFRFFGSAAKNAGNADETNLNRYNIFFGINMAPFSWLTVTSGVNAARLDRTRNRSLRDRFAETRYIPDLSSPLSPNKDIYRDFLNESDKNVDDNRTTTLSANILLSAKVDKLTLSTGLVYDYNEGIRDFFTPSTLMDKVSYVSNYFGYNQRLISNSNASYTLDLENGHQFDFEAGFIYQTDTYKYNYTQAYNGPNDYVKINLVEGNPNNSSYLNVLSAGGFYVFRFMDKQEHNMLSAYGSASYSYRDLLKVRALFRRDGSSNGQPDSRWVNSPAFSASYNLKEQFLKEHSLFQDLQFKAAWGRTVKPFLDNRYAAGPQYRLENGWDEEPTIPGYGPTLGINRPYNSGYVGYGISLPYADRLSFGFEGTMLNDRLNFGLTLYNRDDKNQIIGVPLSAESGYTMEHKTGLEINNKGIELLLNTNVIEDYKGFKWTSGLNFSYNKNKVSALPDGLRQVVVGDNMLQVGKSVGSFWLYENTGIYNTDGEVPTGRTFNGIVMKEGDPMWRDNNLDNRVDNKDKVLKGDRVPKIVGGWNNTLSYKRFDLNFNFTYALGHKAVNQYDATRYGFINREAGNDIYSVKEVSSWQRADKQKEYPIYNPWSPVDAYRVDQDLFLEDASYLKLRSLTLGYDFIDFGFIKKANTFKRAYLYLTATNLFTITDFSGFDPELVNFNGYYDGANLSMPRTVVLGVKLDL